MRKPNATNILLMIGGAAGVVLFYTWLKRHQEIKDYDTAFAAATPAERLNMRPRPRGAFN